jgi:hypothetical protein
MCDGCCFAFAEHNHTTSQRSETSTQQQHRNSHQHEGFVISRSDSERRSRKVLRSDRTCHEMATSLYRRLTSRDAEALDLYRRIVSQKKQLEQLRDALEQAYADLRDRLVNRGNDCF